MSVSYGSVVPWLLFNWRLLDTAQNRDASLRHSHELCLHIAITGSDDLTLHESPASDLEKRIWNEIRVLAPPGPCHCMKQRC